MDIDFITFGTHDGPTLISYFLPLILRSTRICASTASLIHHIFTNNTVAKAISESITDVADHFETFHMTYNKSLSSQHITNIRAYSIN